MTVYVPGVSLELYALVILSAFLVGLLILGLAALLDKLFDIRKTLRQHEEVERKWNRGKQ